MPAFPIPPPRPSEETLFIERPVTPRSTDIAADLVKKLRESNSTVEAVRGVYNAALLLEESSIRTEVLGRALGYDITRF